MFGATSAIAGPPVSHPHPSSPAVPSSATLHDSTCVDGLTDAQQRAAVVSQHQWHPFWANVYCTSSGLTHTCDFSCAYAVWVPDMGQFRCAISGRPSRSFSRDKRNRDVPEEDKNQQENGGKRVILRSSRAKRHRNAAAKKPDNSTGWSFMEHAADQDMSQEAAFPTKQSAMQCTTPANSLSRRFQPQWQSRHGNTASSFPSSPPSVISLSGGADSSGRLAPTSSSQYSPMTPLPRRRLYQLTEDEDEDMS